MADMDLVILVADKNTEFAIKGLLSRNQALRFHPVRFDLYVHRERDPGCLRECQDFLRPFHKTHEHALVLFDRDGCGADEDRLSLEYEVEARLTINGWEDRAAAIVLDPELENWVWSVSPFVEDALGWKNRPTSVRSWLVEKGFAETEHDKPDRPKEALEKVLRLVRKPRSSALYGQLAQKVGLSRCVDPAFAKLKQVLQLWFPAA